MIFKYISIALFLSLVFTPICRAEGEIKNLKQFEYWDNRKIRMCTTYDVNGYLKSKVFCRYDGTVEKVERFDRYGNRIEEALYDQKGRLKNGIDGWAAMKWWYEDSHLQSSVSYDENGLPMEKRYYGDSGRLILRQYRDDIDFDPYEAANMVMLLGPNNVPCTVQERKSE